jgi:aspartyl/glutamyl-tRNA(Asn/Gln) amidotransferase C subunit
MPDEITPELFDHLVQLAALELSPAEAEYIRRELNLQLAAIHELEAIPLPESTPPAAHGVPYPPEISAPARPDAARQYPQAGDILAQAPESDEGYIVVPEIPHTELE